MVRAALSVQNLTFLGGITLFVMCLLNSFLSISVLVSFFFLIYFDRSLDSVKHFPLVFENKKFVFGVGEFFNVEQLVEHFQNYPIIGGETGLTTCLLLYLLIYLSINYQE